MEWTIVHQLKIIIQFVKKQVLNYILHKFNK